MAAGARGAGGLRADEGPANGELEAKLDLSCAVPLEIAEAAADTASLAALAAELGERDVQADAAAAAVLAAAGARAAAHLVAVNLTVTEGDVRLARARERAGRGGRGGVLSTPPLMRVS